MLLQFFVGSFVTAINIVVHAVVTVLVIRVARATGLRSTLHPWLRLAAVMVATASVLIIAHTFEVIVWSSAYVLVGAAPEGSDPIDFAFVNYTTLGYGDVTPSKAWRLLGPMTAMNGVLMFGWSTAVLFEVLRKTVDHHASSASSYDA
jgi:Ion channel